MIVDTEYVKKKIKGRSFSNEKDRDYINALLALEEDVLHPPRSWAGNCSFHQLKGEYQKDYEAILKELKPKKYKEYKEAQRAEKKKWDEVERKQEEEWEKEEAEEKKDWLALGGKE